MGASPQPGRGHNRRGNCATGAETRASGAVVTLGLAGARGAAVCLTVRGNGMAEPAMVMALDSLFGVWAPFGGMEAPHCCHKLGWSMGRPSRNALTTLTSMASYALAQASISVC